MPDGAGPCRTWPVEPSCSCLPEEPGEWDPQIRSAVETATEILWRLTAGRFGLCYEIVRPCRPGCRTPAGTPAGPHPTLIDGRWINLSSCGCGCPPNRCDDCDCGTGPDRLTLPGPVYAPHLPGSCPPGDYPVTVWINGEVVDPTAYWVEPPATLTRIDGRPWPHCQDMSAPHTSAGAFAVAYWRGTPVPPGGRRAVSILACEIHKACIKDTSCALPARVQTVEREGISYTMIDPMEFIGQGRTGLTQVDLWVGAVNPAGARSPSGVWSPDLARPRHQGVHTRGWGR